jgi:hypothetical protein
MPLSNVEDKFQGYPVRDSFVGYISPRIRDHIESLEGFIARCYYPDPFYPELPKKEIGTIGNVRIIIDNRMDPSKIRIQAMYTKEFNIK